jgi:hypothetical protein
MNWKGLSAALGLIAATNLLVLVGVWRNRSGPPQSTLELTEREFWMRRVPEENTGLSLRLDWDTAGDWENGPDWFGRDKLEALGFDCSVPIGAPRARERYRKVLPRETFAALEYDGEAWQRWLRNEEEGIEEIRHEVEQGNSTRQQLDNARRSLERRRRTRSRLFVVDVGNDPDRLRSNYPDGTRFMILPAVVRLHTSEQWDEDREEMILTGLYGDVEAILVDSIHVPRSHRPVLDSLREEGSDGFHLPRNDFPDADDGGEIPDPRFTVRLLVGSRHEPWIDAVRPWEPPGETAPDAGP